MRSSHVKAGLWVVASGLVVAGVGQILTGVGDVGSGSTALTVVGGVIAAIGFIVLAHGVAWVAWLGPDRREGALPSARGLQSALYTGAAGFTVFGVGALVGGVDTSAAASGLPSAANALQAVGGLAVAYALVAVAVVSVGEGTSQQRGALAVAVGIAAVSFFVSAIASFLAAVGFSTSLKPVIITGGVIDAASTGVLFAAALVGALWGIALGPGGLVLVERASLRAGLLVGALGLLCNAVGSMLSALALVGSGHEGVFVAGDVVQGAGLWVVALGVVVIASLGVGSRGGVLARPPDAEVAPSLPGTWGYDPAGSPRSHP